MIMIMVIMTKPIPRCGRVPCHIKNEAMHFSEADAGWELGSDMKTKSKQENLKF